MGTSEVGSLQHTNVAERLKPRAVDSAELAAQCVADDLDKYLKQSDDPKRRLKFLAKKTGIHEKTLGRIAERQNRPTYITIFKIYRFLLGEENDATLLDLVPANVATYLKRANPQTIEKQTTYSGDLEKELRANPVMAEIIILCASGPLELSYVRSRFGDYGIKIVEQLLAREAIQMVSHGVICSGKVQINMSPETVATFGVQIAQTYMRPDKCYEVGENFVGFFANGLTEEIRQEWLKIDAEAFKKKVELAKRPGSLGDLRLFTFCVTDVIETKDSK